MTAPTPKPTYNLVHEALTNPESATADRTARMLAMLVEYLEQVEAIDRSEIDAMVLKLG